MILDRNSLKIKMCLFEKKCFRNLRLQHHCYFGSSRLGCGLFRVVSPILYLNHFHDDVIKWKHFPRHWPLVRGIQRSSVNSPHKGQWRGALIFSLICAGINGWVNNGEADNFRCHRAKYDVIVMFTKSSCAHNWILWVFFACNGSKDPIRS